MALSPSPQHSPLLPPSNTLHPGQSSTPTIPLQPQSKRDKRRTALSDKLNELTSAFTQNRDSHYRQQLQALQIDMGLIMQADPYSDALLDDSGEEIAALITATLGTSATARLNGAGLSQGATRRGEFDWMAFAGRWYAKFVEDVNIAAEERDAALTMLEQSHERKLHELHMTNRLKIRMAQEEHRQLSDTLCERLIQTVAQRKNRLMREKEQLDIADSNALLLHPQQFSITNPASPGGLQSNRKTRHTRHRAGDADDVGAAFSGADNIHKRRKKAAAEDNDVGSPAPAFRAAETGVTSPYPYREARARTTASQIDAPLYSIDRLFTEKELLMHSTTAAVAAQHYLNDLKARQNGVAAISGSRNGQVGTDDEEEAVVNGAGQATGGEGEDAVASTVPAASAPEMDRSANQSHHATRSTRNGAASALNLLGDLAVSEKNATLTTSLPIIHPSMSKTGVAPTPPGLQAHEVEEDLAKIEQLLRSGPGAVDEKLLADVCAPVGTPTVDKSMASSNSSARGTGTTAAVPGTGTGPMPMSALSSTAGQSDKAAAAAAPLARAVVAAGGGLKRTASEAGHAAENGGEK
ncbi:MAG: hypothetical protein M1817_001908 [Caeruleum heppii]|nr:MAG: hypothetical protein M1817_001908 [Caeruleum heppii]